MMEEHSEYTLRIATNMVMAHHRHAGVKTILIGQPVVKETIMTRQALDVLFSFVPEPEEDYVLRNLSHRSRSYLIVKSRRNLTGVDPWLLALFD